MTALSSMSCEFPTDLIMKMNYKKVPDNLNINLIFIANSGAELLSQLIIQTEEMI